VRAHSAAVGDRLEPVVVASAAAVHERLTAPQRRVVVVAGEAAAAWTRRRRRVTHFCTNTARDAMLAMALFYLCLSVGVLSKRPDGLSWVLA